MIITLNVDERSYYTGDLLYTEADKRVAVHIEAMDGNLELARRAAEAAANVIKSHGKEK